MTHKPETIQRIKEKRQARAQQGIEAFEARVNEMMTTITAEVAASGGLYEPNNGELSLNEFSRRLGIHETTLHQKRYYTLRDGVNTWLKKVTGKDKEAATVDPDTDEPGPHSRTQRQRLRHYKKRVKLLRDRQKGVELELQAAIAGQEEATKRMEVAEKEVARLTEIVATLSAGNVIALAKSKANPRKPR